MANITKLRELLILLKEQKKRYSKHVDREMVRYNRLLEKYIPIQPSLDISWCAFFSVKERARNLIREKGVMVYGKPIQEWLDN